MEKELIEEEVGQSRLRSVVNYRLQHDALHSS
jgi:hypothetical protein